MARQREASREIAKLIREWKRTGRMTTSRAVYRPRTLAGAQRQAVAIAYGKFGLGRIGRRRRRRR